MEGIPSTSGGIEGKDGRMLTEMDDVKGRWEKTLSELFEKVSELFEKEGMSNEDSDCLGMESNEHEDDIMTVKTWSMIRKLKGGKAGKVCTVRSKERC